MRHHGRGDLAALLEHADGRADERAGRGLGEEVVLRGPLGVLAAQAEGAQVAVVDGHQPVVAPRHPGNIGQSVYDGPEARGQFVPPGGLLALEIPRIGPHRTVRIREGPSHEAHGHRRAVAVAKRHLAALDTPGLLQVGQDAPVLLLVKVEPVHAHAQHLGARVAQERTDAPADVHGRAVRADGEAHGPARASHGVQGAAHGHDERALPAPWHEYLHPPPLHLTHAAPVLGAHDDDLVAHGRAVLGLLDGPAHPAGLVLLHVVIDAAVLLARPGAPPHAPGRVGIEDGPRRLEDQPVVVGALQALGVELERVHALLRSCRMSDGYHKVHQR